MTGVCVGLKPQNIEDITAIIALYRPGPMDSIPRFIACKHNPVHDPVQAPLPGAHSVHHLWLHRLPGAGDSDLPAAGGLFPGPGGHGAPGHLQEEGGPDPAGAGRLHPRRPGAEHRRLCGQRHSRRVRRRPSIDEIYDFANYAFNKAHAVSYAVVAYQTAWFKCHYTREYMAALLTSRAGQLRQGGGVYRRVQGVRHPPAAAGCERVLRQLHRGGGGHPLRPGGHQEHRPGLHPGPGGEPGTGGTLHLPGGFLSPDVSTRR